MECASVTMDGHRVRLVARAALVTATLAGALAGCSAGDEAAAPTPSKAPTTSSAAPAPYRTGTDWRADRDNLFSAGTRLSVADYYAATQVPAELQDDVVLVNRVVTQPGKVRLPRLDGRYQELRIFLTCHGRRAFDVYVQDARGRRVKGFGGNNCGGPNLLSAGVPVPGLRSGSLHVTVTPFDTYTISVFASRAKQDPSRGSA